jgi:alginate O-acetyltransferase complex protein AlgI
MVFSSHLFVFYFLPAALALYYAVPRRAKHLVLTGLSYLFYGWANPLFMFLMVVSTAIDYVCGLVISGQVGAGWRRPVQRLEPGGPRRRAQRVAVTVSICSNLALLGFFKYFNLAADTYTTLVTWLGAPDLGLEAVLRVTLPLGISFYTFQSMSYSIDIYRGHATAIRNGIDFACYVAMFPQLVAGPIIRFQEVADQLQARTQTLEKFARGAAFFGLGMAKKVLLANPCGKIADLVFDAGSSGVVDAWWGVAAYSFQIYFDFSGYSDMAIGLGLMLGFVFPKNFDSPYRSQSITEFWRRWHISLSTWLRDYLYIPLGGNRKGSLRTYVNLAVVMVLGGLWHGANYTFLVWGAIHGGMLALERARGKDSLYRAFPKPAKILITYLTVLVAWVFFRSPDIGSALVYCGSLIGLGDAQAGADLTAGVVYQPYYVLNMLAAAVIVWFAPQTWDYTRRLPAGKVLLILAVFLLSLVVMTTQAFNPFIYFIF